MRERREEAKAYGDAQVVWPFELTVGDDLVADLFDVLGRYDTHAISEIPRVKSRPRAYLMQCMNPSSLLHPG